MSKYTGRDVIVNFAIGNESDAPGGLTFKRLGMMRGKDIKATWDTTDATADQSEAFTKENLVTFKSMEFSGDGVARTEAIYNQAELKAHVINPGAGTGNQPKVWLQIIELDNGSTYATTQGPFIVNEWSSSAPHSDVVTWSITAMSNGACTYVLA